MSAEADESAVAAEAIIPAYMECSDGSGGRCQEGETMVLQAEQEINEVDSNHTIINHVEKNNEANFVAVDGNATPVIMEASREDQELVTVDGGETSIIIDTGDQSILSQTSVIIDDHRELCEVVQVEEAELLPGSTTLEIAPQESYLETTMNPAPDSTQTLLQVIEPQQQFRPVNLSDIMEVVTQYRCKFCNHVCSDTSAMRTHVEQTHVSNVPRISQDNVAVLEQQQLQGGSLTATSQQEYSNVNTVTQPCQGTDVTVTSCDVGVGDDQHVFQAVQEGGSHEEMMEIGAPGLLHVDEQTNTEATDNTGEAVIEHVAVQISELDKNQTIEATTSFMQTDEKEVFLCGQCGAGFHSIEFCRMHMLHAHNIAAPMVENQETEPAMLVPNRVSVATQAVSRKKPGRKRKEEKMEEAVKIEEEEVTNNPEEIEVFETMGKRKVRPPRDLANLYVVSKRKHIGPSRVRTEPFKLNCPKTGCMAHFRTQEALNLHLSCHASKRTKGMPPFSCPFCPEMFSQWRIARAHLWQKHEKDTDMLACALCEYRCAGATQLEIHMELHNSERPFVCSTCGKGFKKKQQLRNHKALHDMDPEEKVQYFGKKDCDICKREFANSKCLKVHMLTVHGKEKQFQCQHCGYSTSRKAMMDLHLRSHTGEKPFACDGCSYVTGDHNSLRRHKMRHTGEKPYRCKHCNYSCIQAISLKSHLKSKHPNSDSLYDCKLCQFRTVSEQSWKNHLRDHDNGLVVTTPESATLQKEKEELQVVVANAAGTKMPNDQVAVATIVPEKSTSSGGQIVYQYNNVLASFEQPNVVIPVTQSGVVVPTAGGQTGLVLPAPTQQGVVIPAPADPIVMDGLRQQTVTLQLPGQTRTTQVLLLQPTEVGQSATAMVYKMEADVPVLMQGQGQYSDGISAEPAEVSTVTVQEVQVSTEGAEQVATVSSAVS